MRIVRIVLLTLALAGMLALPLFFLAGCTTIEHADGSRETSFDAETAADVLKTGVQTYEQNPDRPVYPPGAPFPIYPPAP